MIRIKYFIIFVLPLVFFACRDAKKNQVAQNRTTGKTTILVDESFANVLDSQWQVFSAEYPNASIKQIVTNENKIISLFLERKARVAILSRMLTEQEQQHYTAKGIVVYTDRFAIDGIALVTNKDNVDSTILVSEVISILKGEDAKNRNIIFDNPNSSTVRYFKELAKVKELPKKGVFTLQNSNEVIKYVATHQKYIGVVGVNCLLTNDKAMQTHIGNVKTMGVKGSDEQVFLKPTQDNLINGRYPFLRNVYILNAEGREDLGTGFANWICSPRGQLIVLKSGLGPHKLNPRILSIKKQ